VKVKKKILILGATGFIGRNMLESFSKNEDYEVHAVSFSRPTFDCQNVVWHCVDLRDPKQVDEVLTGVDVVIQAAATTSGSKDIVTKPYIHVTDNAVMNSYLFRSAFEKNVKHVVFFSCTVMYQSQETPIVEDDFDANQELNERYFGVGHTKLYVEKMCEFYSRLGETKFTVVRHSNIYGPHDKFDLERSHVFGATVTKVMNAENEIVVWGTGEEKRDLLYVSDLVWFVDRALLKQDKKYALYNCGYGQAIPIKNLVQMIAQASGKKLQLRHDLSQPTIKTSLCLNCDKAKKELGWEPQVSLEQGIEKTISWWENNVAKIPLTT
jgi:GDP-L-fucose synthase